MNHALRLNPAQPPAFPMLTLAVESSHLVLRANGENTTLHNGDLIQINGRMAVIVLESGGPSGKANQSENRDNEASELDNHRVVVRFSENDRVTVLIAKGQTVSRVTGPRQAALIAELVGLRLRDRRRNVAVEDEGFTDKFQLGRAMDIDPDYVNTLVTRLKLRAGTYGFSHGSSFIESRDASLSSSSKAQQIRLAVSHLKII